MIFEYGAFSSKSTYLVSSALRYLSISLFFVASYRILVQSFYAMKDMKTPVYVAFFTFIINAVSNYLCVYIFKFDIIVISISSVIANIVSFCILYILLMKRMAIKSVINKKIEVVKTIISSLFMAAAVFGVKYYLLYNNNNNSDSRIFFIFKVFILILLGILVYSITNIVLRNDDFVSFINMFKGKLLRKFVKK